MEMLFVTRNIGVIDGITRAVITAGLIYMGFISNSIVSDPFSKDIIALISVTSLLIIIIGIYPLYSLAGISTCAKKDK